MAHERARHPDIVARLALDEARLADFCERWRVAALELFGSVVRDDFRPDSDVDVLVSFQPDADWSLLDHARMEDELATLVGRPVDLLTRRAVEHSGNPIRRSAILSSASRSMRLLRQKPPDRRAPSAMTAADRSAHDLATLADIVRADRLAQQFVAGFTCERFLNDEKTQAAVLHEITVIGEAVKRLSDDTRTAFPAIPWRLIAGMRDRLIHHYDSVDLEQVWKTVTSDIPDLIQQLDAHR